MSRLIGWLLLLALGVSTTDAAAQQVKLVAVLPLDTVNSDLNETLRATLEEMVRTIAGDELRPYGYTVLTGETMLEILAENDIDAAKACEASCALDAARELNADLFISGSVAQAEGEYIAFIRLFESATGKQLSSLHLEGAAMKDLRADFATRARSFFSQGLGIVGHTPAVSETRLGGAPAFELPQVEQHIVPITTDPPGAVVLVAGRVLCQQTPCQKAFSEGTHLLDFQLEHHEPAQARLDAKRGARVSVSLKPSFARVAVRSEPSGLRVSIDGRHVDTTPLTSGMLSPGAHEVVIDDPCWYPEGQRVVLEKSETRTLELRPTPREGAVQVIAEDEGGNALVGEIVIDGQRLGRTPATVKASVCAKELVVLFPGGARWEGPINVRERQTISVTARPQKKEPPKPEQPVVAGRFDKEGELGIGLYTNRFSSGLSLKYYLFDHMSLQMNLGPSASGWGGLFASSSRVPAEGATSGWVPGTDADLSLDMLFEGAFFGRGKTWLTGYGGFGYDTSIGEELDFIGVSGIGGLGLHLRPFEITLELRVTLPIQGIEGEDDGLGVVVGGGLGTRWYF